MRKARVYVWASAAFFIHNVNIQSSLTLMLFAPEERRKSDRLQNLVYLAHGESDAAEAMAQHIRVRFDWNVVVPHYEQKVELV